MYSEIALFDRVRSGELLNRLSSDVQSLGDVISYELTNRVGSFFTLCGCIAYILWIQWKLFCAMMAVFPFIALISHKYGSYFEQKAKITQDAYAAASSIANEAIANIRTVRSFANERYHIQLYNAQIEIARQIAFKMAIARGKYRGFVLFLDSIGMAIVMIFGGLLVLNEEMNIADYTTFILYAVTIKNNMKQMIDLYSSFKSAIGSSFKVFGYIEKRNEQKLYPQALRSLPITEGNVEFREIKFAYPTRPNQIIFDGNFNLQLEPNTITALVGMSGSGKSTICSLLMSLYKLRLDDGDICIDGQSLNEFDKRSLHQNSIAIVSQEPVLFSCSIAQSIAYGKLESATRSGIITAAQLANADEFILRFEDGYDALIGERGLNLSGGQKQRLAIARAFLMNPQILIFDEATSALDSKSESLIDSALQRLFKSKTVLIVAHRLSTIKNADNIVVLSKGKIVEQGSHLQLIKNKDSLYHLLFNQQSM